jgi:hypothetical protein
MTQDEIRERASALRDRRMEASRELEIVKAEFKILQIYCDHPDRYSYTVMGDPGVKCPDCGYAT